jgi:hypothetical protein
MRIVPPDLRRLSPIVASAGDLTFAFPFCNSKGKEIVEI